MLPSLHHHHPFQPASPHHHRRRASPDEELAEDDKQRKRETNEAALKDQKLSHLSRFIAGMNMLNPQWATKEPQLAKRVEDQLMGVMFNSNAPLPIFSVGDWWACVRVY